MREMCSKNRCEVLKLANQVVPYAYLMLRPQDIVGEKESPAVLYWTPLGP